MSRNIKKPYCKVCHDAGKPEREYTSHWVKDLTGKTTCPTLLNTECRYCYKLGHTAKFCDVLAKNTKKKEKVEQAVTSRKQAVGANMFEALCDDKESEEKVSNNIVEVKTSWAAIAAKPKEVQVEPVSNLGLVVLSKKAPEAKPVTKTAPLVSKPIIRKSWADWSDSEDEEDEEDDDLPDVNYIDEYVDDIW